jgi:epoxyqueuosine reductase
MDLKSQIRKLAFDREIDYMGVAPVERFRNAPDGHKPGDLLPNAKSVISIGMRMNMGPQLCQRMALADLSDRSLRHTTFSYRWFGYGMLNMYFMDLVASLIVRVLEESGHLGLPIVSSGVEDLRAVMAAFSNRHAAVAAGLGEIGWNGLCLVPDVGPRARFCSIITTADLEPDPMYKGPPLCDVKRCTEMGGGIPICVRICPINNFSHIEKVEVEIEGRRFEYAYMDHMRCGKTVGVGLHPKVLGPKEMIIPDKVEFDTSLKLRAKAPPVTLMEGMVYGRGHFCGLCMLRCPTGSPKAVDDILKGKEVSNWR